jgi:hypothetical protein
MIEADAKKEGIKYAAQIMSAFCNGPHGVADAKMGESIGDAVVKIAEKIEKYLMAQ